MKRITTETIVSRSELIEIINTVLSYKPTTDFNDMSTEYHQILFDIIKPNKLMDVIEVFVDKITFFTAQEIQAIEVEDYELCSLIKQVRNEITRVYILLSKVLFKEEEMEIEDIYNEVNKQTRTIIENYLNKND